MEANPRYAEAWYAKGNSLRALGSPEEAIACYDRALEVNPRYAAAWYNKGLTLGDQGRPQEEIACFEKFVELAPPQYASHVERAGEIIRQLSKQN